jgi:hypothetical protein
MRSARGSERSSHPQNPLLFSLFTTHSNSLVPSADPITANTSQPNLSLTLSVNGEGTGEVMLKAD